MTTIQINKPTLTSSALSKITSIASQQLENFTVQPFDSNLEEATRLLHREFVYMNELFNNSPKQANITLPSYLLYDTIEFLQSVSYKSPHDTQTTIKFTDDNDLALFIRYYDMHGNNQIEVHTIIREHLQLPLHETDSFAVTIDTENLVGVLMRLGLSGGDVYIGYDKPSNLLTFSNLSFTIGLLVKQNIN